MKARDASRQLQVGRRSAGVLATRHTGLEEKRAVGPYAFYFWTMVFCNCIFPLMWWSRKIRRNVAVSMVIAVLVNVGMWFERYNIIVSSLVEDFVPGSWGHYEPSLTEIGITIGLNNVRPRMAGWRLTWSRVVGLVSNMESRSTNRKMW